MNIGIIVHSNTGNTLSVAQKLKDILIEKGHTVALERVTAMNDNPNASGGNKLKDAPDTASFDLLLLGAPVWAFTLSGVMKEYISQLPSLSGKKVACFVTQNLPHAWMGGNRAIRYMKKACSTKGAIPFETGIINWSGKTKEAQIQSLIEQLTQIPQKL